MFTNDDQPGRLTLIKQVDNGTTGATATPANWTLSATGPTPISGTSGATEVTNAAVDAGTYALVRVGRSGRLHALRVDVHRCDRDREQRDRARPAAT